MIKKNNIFKEKRPSCVELLQEFKKINQDYKNHKEFWESTYYFKKTNNYDN